MIRITIFYHVMMTLAVVWLLNRFRHRTTAMAFLHLAGVGLITAMALGFLIGDTNCVFGIPVGGQIHYAPLRSNLRLFAQGIFFEGTLFLAGGAVIAWRQRLKGKAYSALAVFGGILALLNSIIGIDALFFEPTALVIRRLKIESEKISRPVRVVFVTDIQADRFGGYEKRVFDLIREQRADLILFGGDYLQYSRSSVIAEHRFLSNYFGRYGLARNLGDEMNHFLRNESLGAPLGVLAVPGAPREVVYAPEWFANTGVQFFPSTEGIRLSDELGVVCGGTDGRRAVIPEYSSDKDSDADETTEPVEKRPFVILFRHHPQRYDSPPKGDLVFAGHTHGGQVQIPGIGPIFTMTAGLPRRQASGHRRMHDETGRVCDIIVSHGVGMERSFAPRVRFLCRPDFWVVDLVPK